MNYVINLGLIVTSCNNITSYYGRDVEGVIYVTLLEIILLNFDIRVTNSIINGVVDYLTLIQIIGLFLSENLINLKTRLTLNGLFIVLEIL